MRVLIYFKPREKFDNFEGARMRKTIKGALEINNIDYTSDFVDYYDIAHFVSPNDELKINNCIENKMPVVISALYSESDIEASFIEYAYKKEKRIIKLTSKALRVLNKVNLVLVPSEQAKQFLIKSGIETPIKVVSAGINVARFNYLRDEEFDVFYRYYREDKNKKLVISIGSYDNLDGVSAFIKCAKLNPNAIFYYFAQHNAKINSKYRLATHKAPKNCHFVNIPNDDIYRSALVNSSVFMYNGYDTAGIVSILEAMAAKTEIVIREQPLFSDTLINEKTCHVAQYSETLTALACECLQEKIYPTKDEAYNYALGQGIDKLGEQLKDIYNDLLKLSGNMSTSKSEKNK